jgi:glutamate-1-semialdehyde 2,1-aminomutase
VREAWGSRVVCADGVEFVDLCLGDTGAMAGHAPPAVLDALQGRAGITTMLPTEDAAWVGEELDRRFGLPRWLFTLTATDANRTALRLARLLTGRPKILVFSYCYHGSVDEAFAVCDVSGKTVSRAGNVGPPVDVAQTTVAIEFNDLDALEAALATGEIACVLAEPAMTNIGIVLPEPGFHEVLRDLCTQHGTLLINDETHTFSAGPGGCTQAWELTPDFLTIGKALGGGVPCGALGLSAEVEARLLAAQDADLVDTGGIGGTLAGNALSLAAMRACLSSVLTDDVWEETVPLAGRWVAGVRAASEFEVVQLGCRAEYRFGPARNGGEAAAASNHELERFLHLFALNRGVLLTPFHNMALMAPTTTEEDVDRHSDVFAQALQAI